MEYNVSKIKKGDMKMRIERVWIREDEFEIEVTLNYASAEKRHGIDETYIYDKYTRRAYMLDDSRSLRPEMDGASVKRRIKKSVFDEALNTAIEIEKECVDMKATEPEIDMIEELNNSPLATKLLKMVMEQAKRQNVNAEEEKKIREATIMMAIANDKELMSKMAKYTFNKMREGMRI